MLVQADFILRHCALGEFGENFSVRFLWVRALVSTFARPKKK
jgi:hypothetical protein